LERLRYGAHMPTSKGIHKVPKETREIGGNAFQIFNHSPRSWKVKELEEAVVGRFRRAMDENGIDLDSAFVHSGYLVNLAGPKEDIWRKSIDLLVEEVELTHKLGLKYVNIHPGSHLGDGERKGIERIVRALEEVLERTRDLGVMILLENVSPKGGNIGYKLEQLKEIMDLLGSDRIGLTYDTCHGFDAGYDITTKDGVRKLLHEIDSLFGLDKLKMIHLNDSKYPLGVPKDRHENIGKGFIGREGFKTFLEFEQIRSVPLILETPGSNLEHAEDLEVLKDILKEIGVI